VRIGSLERRILFTLASYERNCEDPPTSKYYRMFFRAWKELGIPFIPLLWLRNRIFGERVTAAGKANFSRAVKTLTHKGLIKTRNHYSDRNYQTHGMLTERGVNFLSKCEKLTLSKEGD
jgi:hypothetical protein